jgi:hypothetical protein
MSPVSIQDEDRQAAILKLHDVRTLDGQIKALQEMDHPADLLACEETDEAIIRSAHRRFQVAALWPDGDHTTFLQSGANEKDVALAVDQATRDVGFDVDYELRIHPVKRADQVKAGEVVHLDGSDWHVTAVRVMPGAVRLVLAPRYAPELGREQMVEVVR